MQFTRDNFGENSEEYILAQQQNFHGIFNALRLLNKYKFSTRDKDYALTLIEKSRKLVDGSPLSHRMSAPATWRRSEEGAADKNGANDCRLIPQPNQQTNLT